MTEITPAQLGNTLNMIRLIIERMVEQHPLNTDLAHQLEVLKGYYEQKKIGNKAVVDFTTRELAKALVDRAYEINVAKHPEWAYEFIEQTHGVRTIDIIPRTMTLTFNADSKQQPPPLTFWTRVKLVCTILFS